MTWLDESAAAIKKKSPPKIFVLGAIAVWRKLASAVVIETQINGGNGTGAAAPPGITGCGGARTSVVENLSEDKGGGAVGGRKG